MKNKNTSTIHKDVYSIVNDRIIEHLEKGVIPWRQPWTKAGLPKNLITGKPYHGINTMLLTSMHHAQNHFLTFKQAKSLGASVKKGEKGQEVIYWNWIETENEQTKKKEKIPFLQYYKVFNISQCDGIPPGKLPQIVEQKNDPIKSCEEIIAKMPNRPEIKHEKHRACYYPNEDYINMPERKFFTDSESYYGILFHELVHSSGHSNRLNRKELMESNHFGSELYAKEELTAEMGACYLKSFAGLPIEQLENNASYIQSWLEKLKKDKKLIVHASAQAQKATDYILDIRTKEKELEVQQPAEREKELQETRGKELNEIRKKSQEKSIDRNR